MVPMTYTEKMCTTVATQLQNYSIIYLGLLHVTSTGSLLLNFQPFDSSPDPCIFPGLQALNDNGNLVLLSIGGTNSGQAGGDYANMMNNYDTFLSTLISTMEAYGIAGVDLDLEGSGGNDADEYTPYLSTLVQLVNDLSAKGYLVTAPPYEQPQFWKDLAVQSAFPGGYPRIYAYNIQMYGSSMTYGQWVDVFADVTPIPQEFVGSGWDSGQNTPAQITSILNAQLASYPNSLWAYTWRFPVFETGYTAPDYAAAIAAASPTSSSADVAARVRAHREQLLKKAAQ